MSQIVTKSSTLDKFSRLSPAVYLSKPVPNEGISNVHAPDLILLLGWMNASPRHLSKYAASYMKLYPEAQIMVVLTSSFDASLRSKTSNYDRIRPVLKLLHNLPQGTKLLLHLFSNGGAFTAAMIARKYQETKKSPLPLTAMVLDSTPGIPTYAGTVRAFEIGLPKNIILRAIGIVIFRTFLFLYMTVHLASGRPNVVERARRELNDKTLFELDAPRMYVYSVADDLVEYQHVEEHAEDAKALGYTVAVMEKYNDSGHAAHLLQDEPRYVAAIKKLWESTS